MAAKCKIQNDTERLRCSAHLAAAKFYKHVLSVRAIHVGGTVILIIYSDMQGISKSVQCLFCPDQTYYHEMIDLLLLTVYRCCDYQLRSGVIDYKWHWRLCTQQQNENHNNNDTIDQVCRL